MKVTLSSATFRFYQDGNTTGTCGDIETLDVELEFNPGDTTCWPIIRTDGWSANDAAEIAALVANCQKVADALYEIAKDAGDAKE